MNGKANNQAGWAKARIIRYLACIVIYFLMLSITFAKNSGDANNPCKIANAADANIKANIALLPQSAALVAYYKLDDNDIDSATLLNEMSAQLVGELWAKNPYPGRPEPTGLHHVEGLCGGGIYLPNAYPVTYYFGMIVPFTEVWSKSYSLTYLCKATDFRGSILAANNLSNNTMIDIATLFHNQSYYAGGVKHIMSEKGLGVSVPDRFSNQWALFTHRITQEGPAVRVRLGINGHDYINQAVGDFDLSAWGKGNPHLYGNIYLGAYNNNSGGGVGIALEGFKCSLDELRIYSGVLTDADIKELCNLYGLTYQDGDYKQPDSNMVSTGSYNRQGASDSHK